MNRSNVICLGEALVDRLGPLGGDPACDQPFLDCLGGAPANVACGLAKLGIDVSFIGCLGDDLIGEKFCELFISRGINLDCMQIDKDSPTRVVLVKRDINGERTFGGFLGKKSTSFADQSLNLNILREQWPLIEKNTSWLLLGTILLIEKNSRKVVQWIIDKALSQNIQLGIDLNWRPTFWDANLSPDSPPSTEISRLIMSIVDQVSLIKLAKEEAYWFFRTDDPMIISNSLSKKPNVVVTDGSNPIKWRLGGFEGETKAIAPRKILDTTGAGDSFMAGIMTKLILHSSKPKSFQDAENMIRFAAACGALVCSGEGAISPQPNYFEVEQFLTLGQ